MNPYPKRCLIFSPHPDDDIISMGGTFMRLQDQGHEVHVAYQTSGNIAVTDEFVTRFLDFAVGFENMFGMDSHKSQEILQQARGFLQSKKSNQMDTAEIRSIKGLIRRCEAAATCRYVGINENNIHFQNLPFYETGRVEKKPMGEEDVQLTVALLKKIKPHQIYCAGDLADPHGTHKVCLDIVFESIRRIKAAGDEWLKDCWVWLYKGAWQEWDISDIEMAIPMSPDQVLKKRFGIFIHQSQKDAVPFQGSDAREFWQRAEERNRNTAMLYEQLGPELAMTCPALLMRNTTDDPTWTSLIYHDHASWFPGGAYPVAKLFREHYAERHLASASGTVRDVADRKDGCVCR